MKNSILMVNESTDPYFNLALEEYLLTHYEKGTIIMLWQNERTIVVGRHQNTLEEINRKYVEDHGIRVVRRMTGGGAVYHDLGNLNYSFITDRSESGDEGMKQFAGYVIRALAEIGVEAAFSGRNDILVQEKKVSGTAQHIHKNRILHHGCLLYASDIAQVAASLNVRAEKFQSKSVKSVRSRVGNITDFLEEAVPLDEFKKILIRTILQDDTYRTLTLTPEELAAVERLKTEKYESWSWNYGNPIPCSVHNVRKLRGGFLEICAEVVRGIIENCRIYGDYMALRPSKEIEEALIGCRFEYAQVMSVLKKYKLEEYFGSISDKELAETILGVED
ncbi:lipoate--protein ligase [Hespellia stercorisuis]|uniref:lipoate--protein ligase n=1 Tax=Hespellia stercorisuis DSM 15480 TaxID=1121950 RepID=A0A1M6J7Z9_9FIRM|nr:lipoate--protein ligase [Hespellia stercorisuis]SHJ42796.1 lipoate-protein ligase A [Hespellia stercorisuis DSM 15480]